MADPRRAAILVVLAVGLAGCPAPEPSAPPPLAPRTSGLPAAEVQRVVLAQEDGIRACYEGKTDKDGIVTMAWHIETSGRVSEAHVASTTLNDPNVEGCVTRLVESWRFPLSDAITFVERFPIRTGQPESR